MSPRWMRWAKSASPKIPTVASIACVSQTYVSVADASYPPMSSRVSKSASRTYAWMKPKTVFVKMPAHVAAGYAANRR